MTAISERSIEGQVDLDASPMANKPASEPATHYKQIRPSTDWYSRHDMSEKSTREYRLSISNMGVNQ